MTERQRAVEILENLREQEIDDSIILDFLVNNYLSGSQARSAMEEADVELNPFAEFEED